MQQGDGDCLLACLRFARVPDAGAGGVEDEEEERGKRRRLKKEEEIKKSRRGRKNKIWGRRGGGE